MKSAVLLAASSAPGETTVIEKEATRDHTEQHAARISARRCAVETAWRRMAAGSCLRASRNCQPRRCVVPADPSSAAFPLVAALIVPGSDMSLEGVMTNPLRTGLFTTLREMGAASRCWIVANEGGEEVADLRVRAGTLRGVDVPAERAPSMIDEYPILAVAAAFAQGTTRMRGLHELRVKESDRLAATADMLRVNGVEVEIEGDDLIVNGKGRVRGGGMVATHMDHRLAMSALVMGLASEQPSVSTTRLSSPPAFPSFIPDDARGWERNSHDHRHRRAGRFGQRHARQAARGAFTAAPSRYRLALSRGGQGPDGRRRSPTTMTRRRRPRRYRLTPRSSTRPH